MIKQIVEIRGKYYLRSLSVIGWEYADREDLFKGTYLYWWVNPTYLARCSFDSLEILQESIEGYNMKRKELKKKYEAANSVKVVKTYWFKWL